MTYFICTMIGFVCGFTAALSVIVLDRRRPLPHRDQPHVCQAGDAEAEEGTRLVEFILEAKRQAKINEIEQMLEKRKGQA